MAPPFVSVITPSFNQAAYLEQTIRSVLGQDYPNLEYIVIDGGSTDGSREILERFAPDLAYWVSEPDRGQSDAINKGLQKARGDVVAWLNSDDVYLPRAIAEAVAALMPVPDVGMVYSSCLEIDSDGRITGKSRARQYDLADLLAFNIIPQPTVFMKREVLDRVGSLNPNLHFLFDHELWIRAASLTRLRFAPHYWAAARIHSESKNWTRWRDFVAEAENLAQPLRGLRAVDDAMTRNPARVRAGLASFTANYAMVNGDYACAARRFARAVTLQPGLIRRYGVQMIALGLLSLGILRDGTQLRALRRRRDKLQLEREGQQGWASGQGEGCVRW